MGDSTDDKLGKQQHIDDDAAGPGRAYKIENIASKTYKRKNSVLGHANKQNLGEWQSTAICGNDITSSCLYVSALTIMAAGKYAPLALLIVAGVLYLFRKIYAEVGSALPLNGGTYTVLLNTTNKSFAAMAACLTIVSYIATAVISAGEAMHYAHNLFHSIDVMWATIALLGFFAFLNLIGIVESAAVALGIFILHMVTLTLLVIFSVIFISQNPEILSLNFEMPAPNGAGFVKALFLGFAAALLGISGFESSANFIEEQKRDVFPKTLKNMWIAVSIFNPLICLLALGMIHQVEASAHTEDLLAVMGQKAGGTWLRYLISFDAVFVLSGAVLTSFVGVTGLARRMTLDRCMPQVLLQTNRWRRTNHWIILAFFLLCSAIWFVTSGKVEVLAGVYTLSFLCVMALFAIGNMLLKQKRARLPRDTKASWTAVVVALFAMVVGIVGNFTAEKLRIFSLFVSGTCFVVAVMLLRIEILKVATFVLQNVLKAFPPIKEKMLNYFIEKIDEVSRTRVVYFTRGDSISNLNKAALYVLQNEQTNHLRIIHVYQDEKNIPDNLEDDIKTIDRIYPELRIDFIALKGKFGPDLINELSKRLHTPQNYMFIGTPGDRFAHEIASLGGVRLII